MSYTDFQTASQVVGVRTTLRKTYLVLDRPPEQKNGYELTVAVSDSTLKMLKGLPLASERMP